MRSPRQRRLSRSSIPTGTSQRQTGFSLVELSVAMVIALFLLGGVLAMEQSTRQTYGNQNLLAQLQDNQRLAMTLINDVIQSAGYFPDPTSPTSGTAAATLQVIPGSFAQGQPIAGSYGGVAAPGDTISIRYTTATGDNVILCNGTTNTSGATHTYVNQFSVAVNPTTNTSQLFCTLGVDAIGATPIALVDGIEKLQIWYGVKRAVAVAGTSADTYVRPDQMIIADWMNITSVRVQLTFTNPLFGQAGQAQRTIDFVRIVNVMSRAGVTT
jgi:type IV pilus assembly protein PilW